MSDQQVVFDDWQAQIQKIEDQRQQTEDQGEIEAVEAVNEVQLAQPNTTESQKIVDWQQYHENQVEKLKKMSEEEFSKVFMSSTDSNEHQYAEHPHERMVKPIPLLLKAQKQFTELAKLVGTRLRNQAEQECDKLLPENEMLTFFEEFLLYLYPSFQWQNLEFVKEKIKIVKKDRKEEQARAKKLKEKEERLKRTHKREEVQLKSVGEVEGCKVSTSTGNEQRQPAASKEEDQYY